METVKCREGIQSSHRLKHLKRFKKLREFRTENEMWQVKLIVYNLFLDALLITLEADRPVVIWRCSTKQYSCIRSAHSVGRLEENCFTTYGLNGNGNFTSFDYDFQKLLDDKLLTASRVNLYFIAEC